MDVRTEADAKKVGPVIAKGPVTFILVWADYCGHCHTFMPTWSEYEAIPGRKANIVKIHHDMVEKIPMLQNVKLEGYPSVIKVQPDGTIEEYKEGGSTTNALPHMRDKDHMIRELTGTQSGGYSQLASAFAQAIQKAGPASLLLVAHNAFSKSNKQKRTRSFRSPKRSTRRGSTRKTTRR